MPQYEFKHFGKGETVYDTLFGDRYGEHKLVEEWIDGQAKSYLEKDWDSRYIEELFWDMPSLRLIDIFKFENIDLESFPEDFDRDSLQNLITKYKDNEQVHAKLIELQTYFNNHLNGKREELAREHAWDDFNCMFPYERNKCKPTNHEVCEFFGVELEVEGIYDFEQDFQNIEECIICESCGEAIHYQRLISETEIAHVHNTDIEEYVCPHCNDDIFKEEIKRQAHLPDKIKLALVI